MDHCLWFAIVDYLRVVNVASPPHCCLCTLNLSEHSRATVGQTHVCSDSATFNPILVAAGASVSWLFHICSLKILSEQDLHRVFLNKVSVSSAYETPVSLDENCEGKVNISLMPSKSLFYRSVNYIHS